LIGLTSITALVSSLYGVDFSRSAAIQTNWAGGPGETGPVPEWENRFDTGDDVAWRSIQGQLALSAVPRTAPIRVTVAGNSGNPHSVGIGDITGDGKSEILTADPIYDGPNSLGAIYWWEDDGVGQWTQHTVDDSFYGAYRVNTADVDGDGDQDVIAAAYYGIIWPPMPGDMARNGRYAWFENLNGDATAWSQHIVGFLFWGARWVDAADLDGDGDIDLLGASDLTDGVYEQDGDVTWFENLDATGTAWAQHDLDEDFTDASQAHAVDLDGDGDLDVVASRSGQYAWWENLHGDGSSWTKRIITNDIIGSGYLDVGDIDNDGDIDIIGGGYNSGEIYWWKNLNGVGTQWQIRYVTVNPNGGVIQLADLDGDGDLDALFSRVVYFATGQVDWAENVSGDGNSWAHHSIWQNFSGAVWSVAGDANNDGKLDAVVSCEDHFDYNFEQITWWDLTQFVAEGELTSSILDATADPGWGPITWEATVREGTALTVQVRASDDETALGHFTRVSFSGQDLAELIDPGAQFFQYRVELSTTNPNISPVFHEISAEYGEAEGIILSGSIEGDVLVLDWTVVEGIDEYWIYGASNEAFFAVGFAPDYAYRLVQLSAQTTTWSSANGIGEPDSNWTYMVVAVDQQEAEIARSNRLGEFDFLTPSQP
jgi:hypothetical protein